MTNRKLTYRVLGMAGLLALVALGAAACTGVTAPAAAPAEQPRNVITVSGQGEASGSPDIAFIDLGVDIASGDLGEAVSNANETMAQVREAVKGQGVVEEDMQTANFNVWVEEARDENGMPTGQRIYHISNMLRVKVRDIATIDGVIGAGLDAGANSVGSLSFSIDDPSALEAEARVKAVEDAQARAQQLADALGVTLGPPVSVSETFGGAPPIVRLEAAMAEGLGGGVPPISEGQLTVSIAVTIEYEIQP